MLAVLRCAVLSALGLGQLGPTLMVQVLQQDMKLSPW